MSVHPQSGIALCLSSSFCGYHAHAGFLTELVKQGIQPDRISGASAGALVAGLWGAGVRDERLQHLLGSAAFKWAFWEWLAIPRFHVCLTGFGPSGMLTGKRFRKFLHRHIGDVLLENLTDPQIEIAVTNISLLSSQIKSSGKLLDLIVASLAVPMLFAVQKIGGHEYLDGGIANALPYEHWLDQPEIHTIIIHKIAHQATFQKVPWRTPLNVTASAHTCSAHQRKGECDGQKNHLCHHQDAASGNFSRSQGAHPLRFGLRVSQAFCHRRGHGLWLINEGKLLA